MKTYEVSFTATWHVKVKAANGSEASDEAHKEITRLLSFNLEEKEKTSPEHLEAVYCDYARRGVARLV